MHVVIEYESDGVTVAEIHGPFDYEWQAEAWAKERYDIFDGGFDIMELSSVT